MATGSPIPDPVDRFTALTANTTAPVNTEQKWSL